VVKDCNSSTFWISGIPDPDFSQFQAVAGGDVRKASWQACEHILRTIANMPPSGVSAEILFIYDTATSLGDQQNRLKLYLRLYAADVSGLKSIEHLVTGSTLSRFYELKKIDKPFFEPKGLEWNCLIVRREDFIQPLHNSFFNAKIPDYYYTIASFEPNEKNDDLMLDRVLDKITEPVVIRIRISPIDISRQLYAHTGYLARLASVNRSWDDEYETESNFDAFDLSDNELSDASAVPHSLKPLSCKDPLADDIFRQQKKFHESLRKPHLHFEISIAAKKESSARLVGSVLAESAFEEGLYKLVIDNNSQNQSVASDSGEDTATKEQGINLYEDLRPLTQLATVDELLGVFRLPVASFSSPFCIRKNTDPQYIDPKELIVLGYDQHSLSSGGKPIPRGIHVNVLKKHGAVLGLPGMGKNTNNINMLIQLWEKGIPFLVIESAKTEYRALKKFSNHENPAIRKLAKDLKVFTVGNQTSPLNFNPLRIPDGIALEEHIENILACFKAVLPVSSGSLPALLGEALEVVYEQFPNPDKPPIMSDLVTAVQQVLNSKGYSPNTRSDMQTVIEVRLGVLAQRLIGKVFGCRNGISIEDLIKKPTIVELDRFCSEQKCLLTLFKLSAIREILKTLPAYNGPLRFAILIEEAHNIFGSSKAIASEEVADPKTHLADFLSQMMVELRALGVAIILSDQHPSALDPGAIRTPASKLAFLQVAKDDREELGKCMLFDEVEMQDIARLKPGEAFLFTEGYYKPRRIQTINLHDQLDLSTISDQQLYQIISTEDWFIESEIQRIKDELDQFKDCMDILDGKRKQINLESQRLIGIRDKLKNIKNKQARMDGCNTIIENLRINKKTLSLKYRTFIRNVEKRVGHLRNQQKIQNAALEKFSKVLFTRLDNAVKPSVKELLSFLDSVIKECKQLKVKEYENG